MRKYSLIILVIALGCNGSNSNSILFESQIINIFQENIIHYSSLDSIKTKYETVRVRSQDNGREIITQVEIPDFGNNVKITAKVNLRPIPKDILSVYDPWDRAGHVRLVRDDGIDVEILKFITAYGGKTEWEVDVSHLAPIIRGSCEFLGWVDTWVTPAWIMDFSLTFKNIKHENPEWIQPVFYKQFYELNDPGNDGLVSSIEIPDNLSKVEMYYLISGHCTDGRGADEFEPKDNVFYVDSKEVHRLRPWRTDCKQFRAINPYTRRWSSGDWSSDFDRTNWCPGDKVDPIKIDLSEYLSKGTHQLRLVIEDVRPKDKEGYLGYWRVSAYILGWK